MKKSRFLIVNGLLLLVLLLSGIPIILAQSGWMLSVELVIFIITLALSLLSFFSKFGKKCFLLVYALYILNLLGLWVISSTLYLVLLLVSIAGFLFSVLAPKVAHQTATSEPHSMVFDAPAQKEASVKATHTPGKYVASARSNLFHEPKCEWALKIDSSRRIWFAEKKDAYNKGYRSHSCVAKA